MSHGNTNSELSGKSQKFALPKLAYCPSLVPSKIIFLSSKWSMLFGHSSSEILQLKQFTSECTSKIFEWSCSGKSGKRLVWNQFHGQLKVYWHLLKESKALKNQGDNKNRYYIGWSIDVRFGNIWLILVFLTLAWRHSIDLVPLDRLSRLACHLHKK